MQGCFVERALVFGDHVGKEPYSELEVRAGFGADRALTGYKGLCKGLGKSPRMQGCSVERALERRAILWKEPCNTWLFCGKSRRIEGSFAGSFAGTLMLFCGKSPLQKGPWIRRV